jgi:hypothetical protein
MHSVGRWRGRGRFTGRGDGEGAAVLLRHALWVRVWVWIISRIMGYCDISMYLEG